MVTLLVESHYFEQCENFTPLTVFSDPVCICRSVDGNSTAATAHVPQHKRLCGRHCAQAPPPTRHHTQLQAQGECLSGMQARIARRTVVTKRCIKP